MIDENPYAPPKSVLEDFGQPEMIVKPTKMQRLVRVVLFPVLLPAIATVLYVIIHFFVSFLGIEIYKVKLEVLKNLYLALLILTTIQSIIFSLILEFALLTNRNKNIYSLWGGFLIVISFVLFVFFVVLDGKINKKDIIDLSMAVVALALSSYIITLILNAHISYYNKKIVQAA